jgi:hypothetical protein
VVLVCSAEICDSQRHANVVIGIATQDVAWIQKAGAMASGSLKRYLMSGIGPKTSLASQSCEHAGRPSKFVE